MAKLHTSTDFRLTGLIAYQSRAHFWHFWIGIGWAKIPQLDIHSALCLGTSTAILGKRGRFVINDYPLRLLGWSEARTMDGRDAYVVQGNNWRWPFWWVVLRVWLALCWFEKNLRLTAAIWGLLRVPEPGAMPLWIDFAPLHLLCRKRMHESDC